MEKSESAQNRAKQALETYLHGHGLRCTPERFAILEAVFNIDGNFSPDMLLEEMTERQNFRVSRATVYNNLIIFEQAGLVKRLLLGGSIRFVLGWHENCNMSLVCTGCGKVTDIQDRKIDTQIHDLKMRRFQMTGYSIQVFGLCSKCSQALKRRMKKIENKRNK
ncbi:MAG: transcriptional repressor [Bacteroidaceae bacterium]|nr:transcriptional repressor [Bacteroidaceae bacterium]